jgi:two-component system, LytTR family, sensor kinase
LRWQQADEQETIKSNVVIAMRRRTIVIIHILYWFYIINQFLFPIYVGKPEEGDMIRSEYMNELIISLLLNVISFYAIYFIFPRILAARIKVLAVTEMILLITVIMVVRLAVGWIFWNNISYGPENDMEFEWIWVWNELRLVVISGIYAVLILFMIRMFETQKLRDELVNQRQAGELALLRSQVNPHFLFNTLNSIYSLVYRKSEEAPEAVMRFSSIMRYVLYEAASESVLLEKEIEYLRSYIELEKLRYRQSGLVSMSIEGKTEGISIAPMLLIPFVENAFKHGSKNHEPGITVRLLSENHMIRFEVVNYLKKSRHDPDSQSGGVGLSNIRRRLELIYPGKYYLSAREENDQFRINLLIER